MAASIKGAEALLNAYLKLGTGVVSLEMAGEDCFYEEHASVEEAEATCIKDKQELYEMHLKEFGVLPYGPDEHAYFIVKDGQLVKTI